MPRTTSTRRAKLHVEKLEHRWLLAADLQVDLESPSSARYDLADKIADFAQERANSQARLDRAGHEASGGRGGDLNRSAKRQELRDVADRDSRRDRVLAGDSALRPELSRFVKNRLSQRKPPRIHQVSLFVTQQPTPSVVTVSRVEIRPVVVHRVRLVQFVTQTPAPAPTPTVSVGSESQAEGESAVDNWQPPAQSAVNEFVRIASSRNGNESIVFPAAFNAAVGNDGDFVSEVAASDVQTQGGFIELSNTSNNQGVVTTNAEEPLQNQILLLDGPDLDLSSFSYWLDSDWEDADSKDLIELLELLGEDAESEGDNEGDVVNAAPNAEKPEEDHGDDANAEATEEVFATWSDGTHQGMIPLSRHESSDLVSPTMLQANADVSLQELTLDLDAVIGSARTLELGDAELEIENQEADSSEPVEARRTETGSSDQTPASRAVLLPLIVAAAHRRRKSLRLKLPSPRLWRW